MHRFLEEIYAHGEVRLPNGRLLRPNSHIPRSEAELLYRAVEESNATCAIEVGMAYGISSLSLCDAMAINAKKMQHSEFRLISMDPTQTRPDSWNSAGLDLLKAAGFESHLEFDGTTSQEVLPELVKKGVRCGAAIIDGWHTFDHSLVDFFYVDQMLNVGGFLMFDDVGYPSIHEVIRFILSNRSYELVESVPITDFQPPRPLRSALKRLLRRAAQTNRQAAPGLERGLRRLQGAQAVLLRKISDDHRRFDHFVSFC